MNGKKRNSAFKKKVALEAIREDKSVNEIAKIHEVHPVQVSQWKKQLVDGAELAFEGSKKQYKDSAEEKIAALERKVGQLSMENEWLKKKLGF